MVPGMDLQSQYDQVKKDSIGKSQQETLRDLRRNQTTNPNTDWSSRGVSGFRGAGYQEVNPSQMPTMDAETREILSPVLGTYTEGGQTKEGYYGSNNPYTLEGALKYAHNAGFDPANQTLDSQVRQSGGKLPSLFGTSLANNAARVWGEDYGNNTQQTQIQQNPLLKQYADSLHIDSSSLPSNSKYSNFVPGQDYGDWNWVSGAGNRGINAELDWQKTNNAQQKAMSEVYNNSDGGGGGYSSPTQDDGFAESYNAIVNPEGSGTWVHKDVNGKNSGDAYGTLEYRPTTGYDYHEPEKTGFMGKYFPTAMNMMFSAINPAMGAIMSTARTGLNTGDWKQAIGQGALSYGASELGGAYGKDLGSAMGLSEQLASNVGSGLISTGVNAAGNAALGNKLDWGKVASGLLGSVGGNYLGGLANSGVGGGNLGRAVGGGVKSLASGLASSAFGGNGINLQDLATKTAIGAAAPTLGGIFGNTNEQKNNIANLAGNTLSLANTAYKARKG